MKKILSVFTVFSFLILQSQVISSSRWTDLFSYNNVLHIREDNGKLIAATENGIFFYTPKTGELTKLSKANGLHEVKISAFDYNPETKTGLVGYVNGTMDVIKPDGITYVVDIPLATGYTGSKKINHISITGNRAVVSVNYGVSIFDLEKKEFGDTSFFISNGDYIPAIESVIKDNTVYAVTASAVKKHEINVTFPIYSGWSDAEVGSFNHIDIENNLIALAGTTQVLYGDGNSFSPIPQGFSAIKDVTVTPHNILVTDAETAFSFSRTGAAAGILEAKENLNSSWISDGKIYAATEHSGIFDSGLKSYKPDGPYNNQSYKIFLKKDKMWVASGAYAGLYPSKLGYYYFDGKSWIYPDYFKLNPDNFSFNITDIAVNPADDTELFFTNSLQKNPEKGIFRMKNDKFVKLYNEPHISYIRVPINVEYDENNELFSTKLWHEFNANGWGVNISLQHYDKVTDTFVDYPKIHSNQVQNLLLNDGIAYIASPDELGGSMVLYKYNRTASVNDDKSKLLLTENGIPTGAVCSAIDKTGDLWIGTASGLKILRNPAAAIDELKPKAEPVIIVQNGIAEELFRDSKILNITVDSGNFKWISIEEGGVYYLSPNGERTVEHFTRGNSPLPVDNITDIQIDESAGEVFFVSREGIVSYKGNLSNVTENFGNVIVYPNPVVQANYKGNVKIKGLAERTNIRITDAGGNLVHQAVARGGYYEWDLTNRGKRVASGIYFVLMTNADGTDKATAKIAVVN